ncbi:MAG: HEAT repeat domain-containing protein [Chlamydiales bacterium]
MTDPYNYSFSDFEQEDDEFLTDEIDHEILMHRDAHFGGDFKVMLSYYQEEKLGVHPSIELNRIAYLAQVEEQIGHDLSSLILSASEAEKVAKVRRAYEKLKAIYTLEKEKTAIPRLIADLILSEEEMPYEEMETVIAKGEPVVEELIHIVRSDEAYDPLFPGYGFAPYFAIICLGKIGDARAIIPLFESLEKEIAFDETTIVEALARIGEPAKQFLLKIIKGRPLTKDNINAAFALTIFAEDPQVAIACFEQLQDQEVIEKPLFRTYLLCNCDELKTTSYRESFIQMGQDPKISPEVQAEIRSIVRDWH